MHACPKHHPAQYVTGRLLKRSAAAALQVIYMLTGDSSICRPIKGSWSKSFAPLVPQDMLHEPALLLYINFTNDKAGRGFWDTYQAIQHA